MDTTDAREYVIGIVEGTGFIDVWNSDAQADNVNVMCRVPKDKEADFAELAEKLLRREAELDPTQVRVFVARRYMLKKGRFGYTWQVSIWSPGFGSLRDLLQGLVEAPVAPPVNQIKDMEVHKVATKHPGEDGNMPLRGGRKARQGPKMFNPTSGM
jgi:hypothetical protein